jgi:ABC-type uncharacterized transport system ATPase component
MFVAPLMLLIGHLVEAALRAGDRRAITVSGKIVVGLSVE